MHSASLKLGLSSCYSVAGTILQTTSMHFATSPFCVLYVESHAYCIILHGAPSLKVKVVMGGVR